MIDEKRQIKELNLMNDAMFKTLFRSKEARFVVATFLSKVTGIDVDKFLNADYIGGELYKRHVNEKGKTADIIVKLEDNCKIIVEMNQFLTNNLFKKNNSYAFSNYIEIKNKNTWIYPSIILININNFNYYKVDYAIQEFKLRDQGGIIDDANVFTKYDIILENLTNPKYNIDRDLEKFARLLLSKSMEELEELYEGDEEYMAAVRKIADLSIDPEFIGYYDYEERRQQDIEDAENTGFDKGFEQGIEKTKIEMAKELYDKGVDLYIIAECSKLTEDQLRFFVK